jgi:hypothetical protein
MATAKSTWPVANYASDDVNVQLGNATVRSNLAGEQRRWKTPPIYGTLSATYNGDGGARPMAVANSGKATGISLFGSYATAHYQKNDEQPRFLGAVPVLAIGRRDFTTC